MARRVIIGIIAAVCFGAALAGSVWAQSAADSGGSVLTVRLASPIDSLAADQLGGWIARADSQGAPLLIIELDTPGGRLDSAREIAGKILDSPVPVAVFVAPTGARASSAGVFVLAAAHISAMSPGTTVGAAAPVDASGNDLSETLKEKATQDAAAFLREIATTRGRNPDAVKALESTIFEASAYSAAEADARGVIDFVAGDRAELLEKAHGRKITLAGGATPTLNTEGLAVLTIPRSPTGDLMRWLSSPQIVFILLAAGAVLIVIEVSAPGGFVAGMLGGTLILGAFIGMFNLPVNWLALGLVILGTGFFVAELHAPGWGGFGAAGAVCFLLGGFLLFGDYATAPGIAAPAVRVGFWTLAGVAAFFAVSVGGLWYFLRQSRRIRPVPKASEIVGQTGIVRSPLVPRGTVQVAGELWTAISDDGEIIGRNEFIVVSEIDGLTLTVFRQSVIDAERAADDDDHECAP